MSGENTPTHFDGARLDFSGAMTYGDYLRLDLVLGAQQPRSNPEPHSPR
jgi:tryptophan 2,3-dioxygenase